jgi:hypothetical protein
MSRTITLAGMLIDSWRDQSPQAEPGKMNLPGGAIPTSSRLRGTSDDALSTLHLGSLIALGAVKWESHQGELP